MRAEGRPDKATVIEPDLLDDLRPLFIQWFDSRCWLDAVTVARHEPLSWCTSLSSLHADFVAWLFGHDLAAVTATQFRRRLEEFCFTIIDIHGEPRVPNVGFREDYRVVVCLMSL